MDERLVERRLNEILDSYGKARFEKIEEDTLNRGKMVSLVEIGKYIDSTKLSYDGSYKFNYDTRGNVNISIYMMSTSMSDGTPKVTVPEDMNLISISLLSRHGSIYADVGRTTKTESKNFVELPISNNEEDAVTSKDIAGLCDSDRIFEIYLPEALKVIRKRMPSVYNMFIGPNIFRSKERKLLYGRKKSTGEPVFKDVTLYVTYDKRRKKFKFAYNPEFILICALDEWAVQRKKYDSFEGCYKYILAFLITHEMLHIIHHNTVATDSVVDDSHIDIGDHSVANVVQDSFINCKISKVFSGVDGTSYSDSAPMPRIGIGSKVTVRAEHNEGLKYFENISDLVSAVAEVFKRAIKADESSRVIQSNHSLYDNISDYANADVMITIDVMSNFYGIRGESSNLYQQYINDTLKAIVKGRVFDKYSKVSDVEKVSDLTVIPVGSLVMVKGSRDICYVKSYDSDKKLYRLEIALASGFNKVRVGMEVLNVTVYEHSGNDYRKVCKRYEIKPYDPLTDAFSEGERPKQNNNGGQKQGQPPMGGDMGSPGTQAKVFNVGDIVYVRKAKKYGRILSIDNGKFEIEELENKGVKILDMGFTE